MTYLEDAKLGLPWEGSPPPTAEFLWKQWDNALRRARKAERLVEEMSAEILRNQGDNRPTAFYVLPASFVNAWYDRAVDGRSS